MLEHDNLKKVSESCLFTSTRDSSQYGSPFLVTVSQFRYSHDADCKTTCVAEVAPVSSPVTRPTIPTALRWHVEIDQRVNLHFPLISGH